MFSHDDITRELRSLARAEAHERLSVEAQLLRVGHVDQETVPGAPRPVQTPGWWPVPGPGLLAALGRVRRRVAGNPL
jgi:hypothetical protein